MSKGVVYDVNKSVSTVFGILCSGSATNIWKLILTNIYASGGYILCWLIGGMLTESHTAIPPFSIAAGWAVITLYHHKTAWPGICLATAVVDGWVVTYYLQTVITILDAIVIIVSALGVTLQSLLGASILKRLSPPLFRFDWQVIEFSAVVLTMSFIESTITTFALYTTSLITNHEIANTWFAHWVANASGIVLFGPLFLLWKTPAKETLRDKKTELVVYFIVLLISTILVFGGLETYITYSYRPAYITMAVLAWTAFWAAYRFTAQMVAWSMLILTLVTTACTLGGRGPFFVLTYEHSLFLLQIFLICSALSKYLIVAILAERESAKAAFVEAQGRLAALAKLNADAVIVTDSDGVIVDWNMGATAIFGYTPESIIGENLRILIPSRLQAEHIARLEQARQQEGSNLAGAVRAVTGLRENGEEFPAEIAISVWTVGSKLWFGAILRDITEHVVRRNKLIQLNDELSQQLRAARSEITTHDNIATRESNERLKNLDRIINSIELVLEDQYGQR